MLRIFIGCLIIMGCGGIGIICSCKYGGRVKELSQLIKIIQRIRDETEYRLDPISTVMINISKAGSDRSHILCERAGNIYKKGKGKSFSECWNRAVEEVYNNSSLTKKDMEIVKETGEGLGTFSLEGQRNMISLSLINLNEQLAESKELYATKGKMYMRLGFAAGIALVIILI